MSLDVLIRLRYGGVLKLLDKNKRFHNEIITYIRSDIIPKGRKPTKDIKRLKTPLHHMIICHFFALKARKQPREKTLDKSSFA